MSQPEPKDLSAQPKETLQDEISLEELAALTGGGSSTASQASSPASTPPKETANDMVSVEEFAALQAAAGGKLGTIPSSGPKSPPPSVPVTPAIPATPVTPAPPPAKAPSYSGLEPVDQVTSTDMSIEGGISLLMDVPLRVSVELGRISMTLQQVLGLGRGAIIELERLAGEPVDVLINDKLIGHGEVVVVDEYFGVKITELVEPKV